jgi:hypothetical protein
MSELESKADEIRESACDKPGVLAKRGKPALPELDLRAKQDRDAYYRDVQGPQQKGPGVSANGYSYMGSTDLLTPGQGNVATKSPVF